jgi:hypothetical protein
MFEQGDTFFGGAEFHGKNHPWIIINDPAQHGGLALYVNITSLRGGRFDDLTCVLQAGEHISISHPSYIRFDGAAAVLVSELDKAECRRLIRRGAKASPALLEKVRRAAFVAQRLKEKFRKIL